MKRYSIKQPTGRFLYGTIMAPIAAIAYIIILIAVFVLTEIHFVFGIIGAISCVVFAFYLIRVWRANLYEYKMISKSNPIPFVIENNTLRAYKTTKLDSFDYNKPIEIQLDTAKKTDVKGGINKIIQIEDNINQINFNSSMKFIKGSFEDFRNDIMDIGNNP